MSCFILLYQWKQAACVFLCVWTLSLHTVFGRLIHTVKCVVILAAMLHSIVWIFLHVFIHYIVMGIGMVPSLELLLMVLLWVFWCTSTSHLWKHVCQACTSQWYCWVKSSHELEEQEKRWVQSVNELMGARWWEWPAFTGTTKQLSNLVCLTQGWILRSTWEWARRWIATRKQQERAFQKCAVYDCQNWLLLV